MGENFPYVFTINPQTSDFKNHINIDAQRALLTTYQSLIGILKAFSTIEPSNNIENYKNADIVLADIFNNLVLQDLV